MTVERLSPQFDLLREEYVLVQAWKKTAAHIRSHNWYADTLALDRASVNLPKFLAELTARLTTPDDWENDPMRIVPAPKSQKWRVRSVTDGPSIWEPRSGRSSEVKLRPLAHVSLRDQVLATTLLLCLSDRVETRQGDPRKPTTNHGLRPQMVSYGNRLLCDEDGAGLRHRWGSTTLYRSYYIDYRAFLGRSEIVAENVEIGHESRVLIVHSDLRQFYDRVSQELLERSLRSLCLPGDDPRFFDFARRVLNWHWHKRDFAEVDDYRHQAGLTDFSQVILPQGLVAAGFLSNVVLLAFDEAVKRAFGQEIASGLTLMDACRYVDDLRIVLLDTSKERSLEEIEGIASHWLRRLLDENANGLEPSPEKTTAVEFRGDQRPLIRQSRRMDRIQKAVSGGFDAVGGVEILDAVQGLIRTQQRYSLARTTGGGWSLEPVPDVRDATVSRFAAARFRSTFRSLRPLLPSACEGGERAIDDTQGIPPSRVGRSQADLDDEARAFALGLIEYWIEDPSNIRLLRIGLDLWPSAEVLSGILGLLRRFTERGGPRKGPRRVAWYSLAEIFRAGATETGIVEEADCLPKDIDLRAYRQVLAEEAFRLLALPAGSLPWYLKQQVLLFVATARDARARAVRTGTKEETRHYLELIRFLHGSVDRLSSSEFATCAILARRSFLSQEAAISLIKPNLGARQLEQIAQRDPSFAQELIEAQPVLRDQLPPRLRDDLCLGNPPHRDALVALPQLVMVITRNGILRSEAAILYFALEFLRSLRSHDGVEVVSPSEVYIKLHTPNDGSTIGKIERTEKVELHLNRVSPYGSIYSPPPWCPAEDRWRFQLGFLLRFILTARGDFTRAVRPTSWREQTTSYRSPESHWYQRIYGLHNGHISFGDDWLPISDWMESFLYGLLRWPGCREMDSMQQSTGNLTETITLLLERIEAVGRYRGDATGLVFLPIKAPSISGKGLPRPLRICVVQTVFPNDFARSDLTFSDPPTRRRHRNHLSAALAAVEQMLDLRETHKGQAGRLDWLILPELSVHPDDVRTHLIPFARAHRAIVLAGMTYEELSVGLPLVNSAVWIIPTLSPSRGLQMVIRRQGKEHLAPAEVGLNQPSKRIEGFRPVQWLIGYEWSVRASDAPLWLTGSICYDATDIHLAADLKHRSDVFAVPALNQDVMTFDHMALALHYHMFQMIIVANNGTFGGSNAYAPYREHYQKQVFHLHGQPQATMSFLEIDEIGTFIARGQSASGPPGANPSAPAWKSPPAGRRPS